jgi:hypothetical protein
MKKEFTLLFAALATAGALTLTAACEDKTPKISEPPVTEKAAPAPARPAVSGITGRVVETINAGRYTYVHVDTGTEKIWTATPGFQGKVGDRVVVPEGMAMPNYHSQILNRDFDLVYFVTTITVAGKEKSPSQQARKPVEHPPISGAGSASRIEVSGIEKAEGGKTVAEIFAGKGELAGKPVRVRGKVVKLTSGIMGKNWLHVQDGSGSEGANDLTVTTDVMVKVGDLVLISGVVSIDRDFGFGYKYDAILEDAEVIIE